jgi:guanylate kinase
MAATSHEQRRHADRSAGGPGLLLVVSGPSGVGKTTITRAIERELGGVFSVSLTTRPRTTRDRDGVDYHFVSREAFEAARDAGKLLEWAEVYPGCCYGTPRAPVETALAEGRLVILEIDVNGAMQVKQAIPEAFCLFIEPPSEAVLLQRLRDRKREDEATILRRFAKAKDEIALAHTSGIYSRFVVNDDLSAAIRDAIDTVASAQRKRPEV